MADKSGIEWTDATWNPTTGCDQVSPGCDNCYALTMAGRLKLMGSPGYQVDGDPRTSGPGFALQMHEDRLDQPLRWTRSRRVFVNSMSDLFHPRVTDEFIARVFAVMAIADRHTFQVLTKRPKRMRSLLRSERFVHEVLDDAHEEVPWAVQWPLRNVWLGTSVEDQQRAEERVVPLLNTPAAVRFLSCEPLLGPVDLKDGTVGLDWVIVGGESGPGARPMHPRWVYGLRDWCQRANVPFFFKQWGAWAWVGGFDFEPDADIVMWSDGETMPIVYRPREAFLENAAAIRARHAEKFDRETRTGHSMAWMARVGKHAAGRHLDGRTWDEFPQEVTVHG